MSTPSSSARDRLVTEAARLFSARGYAATSVADVQLAAGLTGGSGALYKHFRSKRDLLAAVVGVHLGTMREGDGEFVDRLPADLDEALELIRRGVWAGLDRDRDVLRVLLRDLDEFPDLLAEVWEQVRAHVYGELTRWLTGLASAGTVRLADPEATAAVLLASLTYLPILRALIGHTPGDVDDERYAAAWRAHARATLTAS